MNRSLLTALCASFAASTLHADSNASLTVPRTGSMVLTVQISITTALGTSSDTDAKTLAVTGFGQSFLAGPDPAWNAVTMSQMHLDPADANFHFDLYCFPFIGCQSLDVALTGLVFDLQAPSTSPVGALGAVNFVGAPVLMQANYVATGVASASGTLSSVSNAGLTGRVLATTGSTVRFDQFVMAPQTTVVDPASLPAGVTALTITVSTNLANTTLVGPYVVLNPYDLDGDGLVGAPDLSILLSAWGVASPADFNGNGSVDAPDLAILLSNWS